MKCPAEIAELLLEIIRVGILNCRGACWAKDVQAAAREADHIHNLPALVTDFKPELLLYYWEVERASYLQDCSCDRGSTFTVPWNRLETEIASRYRPLARTAS